MFVIEVKENQYPELINLEFVQEHVNKLDAFAEGQEVKVDFNLKGRKWTNPQGVDQYFNTLQAWRIALVGDQPAAQPQFQEPVQQSSGNPPVQQGTTSGGGGIEDDIPFNKLGDFEQ